jgi:hypothetical protein
MSNSRSKHSLASPRRATCQTAEHLLAMIKNGRDTRAAKVKRIKAAIEARTYENNLKLQIALERLLRDL